MFRAVLFGLVASALALSASASAGSYSAVYVFGDSLSDRGNFAEAVGNPFADPPSFHYSFSNGPTAISIVATNLGRAADPSLWLNGFADTNGLFAPGYMPGTSYAVGGATAQATSANGIDGINLPDQLGAYLGHTGGVADPEALYTLFIGGNDIRGATLPGGSGAINIEAAATEAVATLETLKSAGAQNFLVINVPDVGEIPQFSLENPALADAASANTLLYNNLLAIGVDPFRASGGIDMLFFDLYALNKSILANAASYRITNVTDPCYANAPFDASTTAACGPGAQNIASFAYWNNVHPTREVHALWAAGITAALPPPAVPEPASWAMMIVGLGLLGGALRLHKGAARRRPWSPVAPDMCV